MNISVIIAAGGSSSRMKGKNKLLEEICGKALLVRTTEVFIKVKQIDEIIIVAADKWMNRYLEIFDEAGILKNLKLVKGGVDRMESVFNGLTETNPNARIVLIHDAARPLVTEQIISDCIEAAVKYGACCAAVPLTDTLKEGNNGGFVKRTLKRDNLYRIQTPQAFIYKDILKLYKKAAFRGLKVTDDAQIAEYFGFHVYLVESDYSNIKITTQTDLLVAESLLRSRNDAGAHNPFAPTEHGKFFAGGSGETNATDINSE